MLLPISSIAVINRQRKQIDPKKLAELADSIKANGLLHPIVVRRPFDFEIPKIGQATHVLCVGGRRLAAHIYLGRTEIEANDKQDLDPYQAEICELEENLKRENITWQEEIEARDRIHKLLLSKNPDQRLEDTAGIAGASAARLSQDIKLKAAIAKDPSLKSATSRASAHRMMNHKEQLNVRAATAVKAQNSDISQKLFTADGSTFIRTLKDKSVDLVFVDLPYMIDYFEGQKDSENMKGQYDDSEAACKDFIIDVLPQFGRVCKLQGWIVLFMCYEWHGWLQTHLANVCTEHFEYRDHKGKSECNAEVKSGPCYFLKPEMPPWIWTRRGKGNHGHWPELHASNRYEMLVVANGGNAHLTKKPVENVLDFPPMEGERFHAMQKPFDLCCEIIERTTVPGELVLDICMGSGAHLAAAAAKGRDFLGCDKNPENLNSALALVSQHYHRAPKVEQQLSLVKDGEG